MTDERSGGRMTFFAFLFMGLIWLVASATATDEITFHALIGTAIISAVGAIVGMFVGFYNLGRERGR